MRAVPPAWPRHDLLPAAGLAIATVRHPLPAYVREHSHDFAELALICSGSGVHRSAGGEQRLEAGDAVLVPSGAWHAYSRCVGMTVLDVGIGQEVLGRELAWLPRDRELGGLGRALVGPTCVLLRPTPAAYRRACTAFSRIRSDSSGAVRLAHVLLAMSELAAALPAPSALPPAVDAALRLLQADPAQRWTVAGLARRLGRDRSHFIRDFRTATGLPPMAWLARLRGELAAARLRASDEPISAIGTAVGWSDPVHFARRFKQLLGRSPGAWRRS
jgi:AraC family transcriptional regulator, L-rhamnose operon transcriptional activator RhaR